MQISTREEAAVRASTRQEDTVNARSLYESVMLHGGTPLQLERMRDYLATQIGAVREMEPTDLPRDLDGLLQWAHANQQDVSRRYQAYLEERRAGAPRRLFSSRTHALYFLRCVAPTKLVDGSWLYSTVRGGMGAASDNLARTYFEELGNGDITKNHVVLYRRLLAENGLEQWRGLPDDFYTQGAIQLSLGWLGESMRPEVIGFNLGYEQLPLHLLITAYELDELGIDPYYFTLHVTVDNPDTGHARRACEAASEGALEGARELGSDDYWARVAVGFQLNDLGAGTMSVIEGFDLEREALAVLERKALSGHGAHSDYCRIEGRTVNEWLAEPAAIVGFVAALERQGWIKRGAEPTESRFWHLLLGERAKMFGVFNDYELQVIFDWIRQDASKDGRAFDAPAGKIDTHRAAERRKALSLPSVTLDATGSDADAALRSELQALPPEERGYLLAEAISPVQHWTTRGLAATRLWLATQPGG